jgi:hypothetical protein
MYDYQSLKYAHNMFHGMYNDIHIVLYIRSRFQFALDRRKVRLCFVLSGWFAYIHPQICFRAIIMYSYILHRLIGILENISMYV